MDSQSQWPPRLPRCLHDTTQPHSEQPAAHRSAGRSAPGPCGFQQAKQCMEYSWNSHSQSILAFLGTTQHHSCGQLQQLFWGPRQSRQPPALRGISISSQPRWPGSRAGSRAMLHSPPRSLLGQILLPPTLPSAYSEVYITSRNPTAWPAWVAVQQSPRGFLTARTSLAAEEN